MNTSQIAKVLGRRGGRARARRLSQEDKKRIASLGGKARLRSIEAAQNIVDNFRYLAAVLALRGESTKVTRERTFEGPLPGIYRVR